MAGYGGLAVFMASRPDTEIFRRFSDMNVESLLHMQAELSALEMSLNVMREDPNWNAFDSSWLAAPRCNANAMVGDLFEKTRVLLEQYCGCSSVLQTTRLIVRQTPPSCERPESILLRKPQRTVLSSCSSGMMRSEEATTFCRE